MDEPFFNRAVSLGCAATAGLASWAERLLAPRRVDSTLLVFDRCRAAERLLASGYRQTDTMYVLRSKESTEEGGGDAEVVTTSSHERWTAGYLRAFYGDETLAPVVGPLVTKLLKTNAATLLESSVGGETAGVLAIFRTRGLAGVYCVGTVPEHRRQGVATGLVARARRMATEEGRILILQTLESDGALEFYLQRGFEVTHTKRVLEKKLK